MTRSKIAAWFAATLGLGMLIEAEALTVRDLEGGLTPQDLLDGLVVGSGVEVSNLSVSGNPASFGLFGDGADSIGFDSGVLLSSGFVADAVGPNTSSWTGEVTGAAGDGDLDAFFPDGPGSTVDAAVLEFDFVTQGDLLALDLIFASEDYLESVDGFIQDMGWYDAFGIFLDGEALPLIPGEQTGGPLSIFEINRTNHPDLFRDNEGAEFDVEYDGFTAVLGLETEVTPGATHHLKFSVADGGDGYIDSAAFVGNLSTNAPIPRAAEPLQIPTLSVWALGALGALLAALAAPRLSPRRGA